MRIPVLIGSAGTNPGGKDDDAWLVEAGADLPPQGHAERFALGTSKFGHISGCTCCVLRAPAADALARMFRARATGAAPFFKRVVVVASAEGEAAVREALADDVVAAARYKLQDR